MFFERVSVPPVALMVIACEWSPPEFMVMLCSCAPALVVEVATVGASVPFSGFRGSFVALRSAPSGVMLP